MSPDRYQQISEVFLAVADAPVKERAALLDRLCAGDAALRAEAERLLEADRQTSPLDLGISQTRIRGALVPPASGGEGIPARIGPYEILGVLGRGGMGTVFRARQASPSREVALKVISSVWAGSDLRRRFEFEAEVLGRLSHPGIARIYEAGVNTEGPTPMPFFAMELVDGRPLQEYVQAQRIDAAGRLRLLRKVCDAVHHAHQKAVVHRDLKPANIVVTSDGEPKVLDFGVARATSADLAATIETAPGQILGTLPYMSPEQVSGDSRLVDARCDIYALGVLLYELLAGRLPFDLRGRSIADAARILTESEPPRLSRIDRRLGGDLETIVAKAMERDPSRRYASAAELGRDLDRHLRGEPIEARRDSGIYVLRKTLWRYRLSLAVAAAFMLVLTSATAISVNAAFGERRQRELAEQRAAEVQQVAAFQSQMLEQLDVQSMGRALTEYFREQVQSGLNLRAERAALRNASASPPPPELELSRFDELAALVAPADVARRLIDERLLRVAGDSIEAQFAGQPLVRAALHKAIGRSYRAVGLYAAAEKHLRIATDLQSEVTGADAFETADHENDLGIALHNLGRYAEAEKLYRHAMPILAARFGEDSPHVAMVRSNLSSAVSAQGRREEAEELLRGAIEVFGAGGAETRQKLAVALGNLGELYRSRGDDEKAEAAHRESLRLRREDPTTPPVELASSTNNLATILSGRGKQREAEPLQREAYEIYRRELGADHPHTISSLHNLANMLYVLSREAEAEPLYREGLERSRRRASGAAEPEVGLSLLGLGTVVQARGDLDEAESLFREGLAVLSALYPDTHPAVATAINNLATILHMRRDYAAAEPLYRRVIEVRRSLYGEGHPDVAVIQNNLAALLRDKGDFAAAESVYRGAISAFRKLARDDPSLPSAQTGLGRVLIGLERYADADEVLTEAVQRFTNSLGARHERTAYARAQRARARIGLGRLDDAEADLREGWEVTQTRPANERRVAIETFIKLLEARSAARDGDVESELAAWRDRLKALDATPPE